MPFTGTKQTEGAVSAADHNPTDLTRRIRRRGRHAGRVLTGAVGIGALSVALLPVGAAGAAEGNGTSAFFSSGILTVVGDAQDNTIIVSRNAAGIMLVNGGA